MGAKRGIISVLLIAVFIFNIFNLNASALRLGDNTEETQKFSITTEQAIDIAAKALPDMKDKSNISSNIVDYRGKGGVKVWTINYSPANNNLGIIENVNIDANTGEVKSFSSSRNYSTDRKYIPSYSISELKQIVEKKIMDLQPDKFGSIEYVDVHSESKNILSDMKAPILYTFTYARKIGDIVFNRDGFKVTINSYDGMITFYEYTWSDYNLPNVNTIMTMDNAKQEFLKYGRPRLMYIRPWNTSNPSENRKLKLIYSIASGPYYYLDFNAINAITGNPVDSNGNEINIDFEKIGNQNNTAVNKTVEKLSKPITENEAKLIALKETLKYKISVDNQDNFSSTYNDNWSGLHQAVYSLTWTKKTENEAFSLKATIDVGTGSILEFYFNNDKLTNNENNPVTWSDSKNKAIAFVKSKFPQFLGNIVLMKNEPSPFSKTLSKYDYYYSFWRTINGVLYPENNVNVIIDNKSGDIIGYGYRWECTDFPNLGTDIISEDAAANIFMDKIGLRVNTRYNSEDQKTNNNINNGVTIYEVPSNNAAYIDPYSGMVKNMNGEDVYNADKMDFSYALVNKPHEAQIFNEIGLIDNKEIMNLDSSITLGRFVKMLVMLKGSNLELSQNESVNSFDAYSNAASSLGWISSINDYKPESLLSLKDMTDILMKYVSTEASNNLKNADQAEFIKNLKIISDDNYDLNRNITLGEAVKAVYNTLRK